MLILLSIITLIVSIMTFSFLFNTLNNYWKSLIPKRKRFYIILATINFSVIILNIFLIFKFLLNF